MRYIVKPSNYFNVNNMSLIYVPKRSHLFTNQVTSRDIAPNIYLKGTPTCNTPSLNSNGNEIATTEFVNEKTSINVSNFEANFSETVKTKIQSVINYIDFYHITVPYFKVENKINVIAEVSTNITLPPNIEFGSVITVVNRSGSYVTVNTQEGQLLYNTLYLPPEGSNTININNNSTTTFTIIKNTTTGIISWSVSIY